MIYPYAPGRGGKHVETLLDGFSGILQVDGYDGYNILSRPDRTGGPVTLAYCWRICAGTSTRSPPTAPHPSPRKHWNASKNCTRSRLKSAAVRPESDTPSVR